MATRISETTERFPQREREHSVDSREEEEEDNREGRREQKRIHRERHQ